MKDARMNGDEWSSETPITGATEYLLQLKNKEISDLESQLKVQKKSLDDEDFLFNNSATFKRFHFSVWLHTKYYQLLDSDAKDPRIDDVDALALEIQKYIPTSLKYSETSWRHYENHYIDKLQQLSSRMSAWAREICNGYDNFTQDQVQAILTSLNKLSMTGGKTVEAFEEHDLFLKFNTRRHHKILYNHLIGLAIYERVLSSFAFGLDGMASKQLYAIQNALLTQGLHTDYRTLMF
jgi:hypothetical protein